MFVRARLIRAAANPEHVLAGDGRVQMELAARPVGGDTDRGVRRETVTLGLAAEVHLDGDMAAAVDVDMAMPVNVENGKRRD